MAHAQTSTKTTTTSPTLSPEFRKLFEQTQQSISDTPKFDFQKILSEGLSGSLIQSLIGPVLQALVPQEEQARQSLTDTFRQAGGIAPGSTAFGAGAGKLEGQIQGNRGAVIADLIRQSLGDIIQGSALQQQSAETGTNQLTRLLQSIPLGSESVISQILSGGGGGGSSSGGSSAAGFGFSPTSQAVIDQNRTNPNTAGFQPTSPTSQSSGATTSTNKFKTPSFKLDPSDLQVQPNKFF